MNHTTEAALRASIAHWEDVVKDPINTNVGRTTCALCMMFNNPYSETDMPCDGCPVSEQTWEPRCGGSPYNAFSEAYDGGDEDAMRTAAVAELEFLKSLLPETTK